MKTSLLMIFSVDKENKSASIENMLNFYMGKNTQDRQDFIISNLKIEKDLVEETV